MSSFIFLTIHSVLLPCLLVSGATGIECRRDVAFIVHSAIDLCTTVDKCNYCWGQFYMSFTRNIAPIQQLQVKTHVYHTNGEVFGCEQNLLKQESCECQSNKWCYKGKTISSLLGIVKTDLEESRAGVPDVIVVVVSDTLDAPVEHIAHALRENKVHVVVVGVGTGVDRTELLTLATDEHSLVTLRDKSELLQSASRIQTLVCSSCEKDVTFVTAWAYNSTGREQFGWCGGSLVARFTSSVDSQLEVATVDWTEDGRASGCQINWREPQPPCSCPRSHWSLLPPSLLYDNIVNRFSNLRPDYPNAVVVFADRPVGFVEDDVRIYRDNDVHVVTVAIGDGIDSDELRRLATSGDSYFSAEQWDDAIDLVPHIRNLVCYDKNLHQTNGVDMCTSERVDVTVVVDVSRSMTLHLTSARAFLEELIDTLTIDQEHQHVTIITFSAEPKILIQDAENKEDVLQKIIYIKSDYGPSNMADALCMTSTLMRSAGRTLTDNGASCPQHSVVILSDGLANNRSLAMKEIRYLKQMGAKISYVAFGDGSTVYENEAMVAYQFMFHHHDNMTWNSSDVDELRREVVEASDSSQLNIPDRTAVCSYLPLTIVFIFDVSHEEIITTFLREYSKFYGQHHNNSTIYVLYPGQLDFEVPTILPNLITYPHLGENLEDALEELALMLDIPRVVSTCFILITDKGHNSPSALFKQVWRLSTGGSKIVTVGVGPDVNHHSLEMLASVPRYSLWAPSVWTPEVPRHLWTRYCDDCGFRHQLDIVFYVEAGTGTSRLWRTILEFLISSSSHFPVSTSTVLVSIVTFAEDILDTIPFNGYNNKMALFSRIRNLKTSNQTADLSLIKDNMNTTFSNVSGSRESAKKVVILVLDAMLDREVDETGEAKIIWFDISQRPIRPVGSPYLRPSDYHAMVRDVSEIVALQNDIHHVVCRDMD